MFVLKDHVGKQVPDELNKMVGELKIIEFAH
jgi:hypothetical protein